MVNDQGEHLVAPGDYNIFVGGSQPGDSAGGVREKLFVNGEVKLPR
jgi:hypothetical protein